LWHICLFASAQRYRLDWEQLFSSLEAVQAGVFAANIFQIGREYLGLALPDGLLSQMERRNGALDMCQGDTKGIGMYSDVWGLMPFAQGMALRLSVELNREERKE
ncbi:MAG: hypothetical protein EGQ81_02910, partial [Akkermansia sp.]|nr:hypothetical protein [Akkermansia sp.]